MKRRILVSQIITLAVVIAARPDSPRLFLAGFLLLLLGQTVRALSSAAIVKSKDLTTSGPYAAVRNPLYLGTSIMTLGMLCMLSSPRHGWLTLFIWIATLSCYCWIYVRQIRSEEEFLASVYGARFQEYRRSVPALLPRPGGLSHFFDFSAYSAEAFRKNKEWRGALAGLGLSAFILARIKYGF